MKILSELLGYVMTWSYSLINNYGGSIILFTLISKIVLLPLSVWVQKNSIKMVKMQPEINRIKIKYFGDADRIGDEQSKIFKREKYNPLASIIPLAVQIVLLLGLVEVIKHPMDYVVTESVEGINSFNMFFCGIDLSWVPAEVSGISIVVPIIAGFSAWLLCMAQNASNVLQAEQSNWNKYGMMLISVGLSLYLGWFVPAGVALYWIASNLFAILQLYVLNWVINPKKYVNYKELKASKQELAELEELGEKRKLFVKTPYAKREKADFKKFFSIVNKHLVFYSENNGFYKYYSGIIEYLLRHTNLTIHYITSDPEDNIFKLAETENKIRPYYIGEKRLITLMMKMDADVVVMTMPDLENFHIKRSYVRKDIEYIYIPHGMDSLNLTMRTGSMDHYDTIFCVGKHQKEEIEKTEDAYQLPKKTLIEWGYTLLDDMRENYLKMEQVPHEKKSILIAPSWQKDNIVDLCLEPMLDELKDTDYQVIVRPHPQQVRHQPEFMEKLKCKYKENTNVEIQTDFSSNNTVFEADLLITDWSSIAYEYAFATYKPVLFIDTPMKIMNPEYQKIDTNPINVWMRDVIGATLKPEEMEKIPSKIQTLLDANSDYRERISEFVQEYVYNSGSAAEVGAKYIISVIQAKIRSNKKQERE